MNRREFLIGASATAAAARVSAEEKTTDGGLAEVSWAERHCEETPLLPAGAGNAERFATRCLGCLLCAAACPSKCLLPSVKLSRLGKVELDFRYGFCRPTCTTCGAVCPVKAIAPLTKAEKLHTHIGFARWTKALCVRTTAGDECHACEKHCPVKAIRIVGGFPVVDTNACIGCGACEHYCPARPTTAIRVIPYERHRTIKPIDESALIDEMKTLLEGGKTLVVAKDGVIVFTSEGHMLEPVKAALTEDGDLLRGAIVADKVVGLAAAKMHLDHGVRKVITRVISAPAKALLEKASIIVEANEIVPKILNRDRTGECPLDAKAK